MGIICWITKLLNRFFKSYSLRSQIMISFAILTIFSVTVVGLTALRINYRYLEQEKRTQSMIMIGNFYQTLENEITNMVVLAASRPSMAQYLLNNDTENMQAYLLEFKKGMPKIDKIFICDSSGNLIAATEAELGFSTCNFDTNPFYTVVNVDGEAHAWLLRGRKIFNQNIPVGTVILGIEFDNELLMEMCDQCNLYHTLISNNQVIATSFGERYSQKSNVRYIPTNLADEQFQESFNIQDHQYYVSHFPLNNNGLSVEVALDVTSIHLDHKQQELILTILILVVLIFAVVFGGFLARCIQLPLTKFVAAANQMENLDLSTPVRVSTKLQEVIELSQVLENLRSRINDALTSLQSEKQWSDLLLESIVEGIIILNNDRVTYFSPGAERITNWQREEVNTRSINEILKPADHTDSLLEMLPPLGEKLRCTFTLKDDKKKILSITHAQLLATKEEHNSTVLVLRDVSEEEALSHLLGSFLGNITHEFRTPLSALAASIEILLSEADDLSQPETKELLRSIHLSTLNLENLIDNLLEGSSIETGRFRVSPQPTDLRKVIYTACETIDPLLKKYGQNLKIGLPAKCPLVLIDGRRINQVLLNLLSNASKYGPIDGEIELNAKVLSDFVEVSITDCGKGIPPAYWDVIFSGFVLHLKDEGLKHKGAGLGLSVSNAIVKAHGGLMGVRNHEGSGAEFWFTVPITGEE